jgi:hypothetical protein
VSDRSTSNVPGTDQASSLVTPPTTKEMLRYPVSTCSLTSSRVGALIKHRKDNHPNDMGIFARPRYSKSVLPNGNGCE